MFKKEIKKKVSIDFDELVLDMLIAYRNQVNAPSNSAVVNFILDTVLDLSDEVKGILVKCCIDKIHELQSNLIVFDEFGRNKAKYEQLQYKKLIRFFSDGKDLEPDEIPNMRRINIMDGYVIFPENWIVTKYENAKSCQYAGVIETKNGSKYNIPHFIVFSSKPISEITKEDSDKIFLCCCQEYPEFQEILKKDIPIQYDEFHKIINGKEWLEAPHPAIFPIKEYRDADYDYPYGAMIIKNKK